MNNELKQLEEKLQEAKDLVKTIEDKYNELQNKPKNVRWRANKVNNFYSYDVMLPYIENFSKLTNELYQTGNYFKTKEEAKGLYSLYKPERPWNPNMIKQLIKKKERKYLSIANLKHNAFIRYYKPKKNKVKVGLLVGFLALCLITPCTNWLIPIVFKLISKFSPLWIYK